MIFLYEFEKKKFVPLVTLLKVCQKINLSDDFLDYIRSSLCFYYVGDIYFLNKKTSFKGLLKTESDLLTMKHVEATLYFSKANDFVYEPIILPMQEPISTKDAYTIGGHIASDIAIMDNNKIINIEEEKLFIPNKVLPYYLLNIDLLSECEYDGLISKAQLLSITHNHQLKLMNLIEMELADSLGTPEKPNSEILEFRLQQQKEATEHAHRNYMHKVQHLKDYRGFLEESQKENAGLREQLKVLLAEIASLRPNSKNTKQAQREALLEKLLVTVENLALEKAKLKEHEDFIFSREYIRATREDMQNALKRLEYLETGHGTLFTIELSTFEGFWKKQTLCRLAVGVGQSIDARLLLDELFYINND